jgi:hypothetical protein
VTWPTVCAWSTAKLRRGRSLSGHMVRWSRMLLSNVGFAHSGSVLYLVSSYLPREVCRSSSSMSTEVDTPISLSGGFL